MKSNEFPIPVISIGVGPGSQPEDEQLAYLPMPQGMETFRQPLLPEPEEMVSREQAHLALRETLAQLKLTLADGINRRVNLMGMAKSDLLLINQVLGEGEVSVLLKGNALVDSAEGESELRVQESVFAGIWRVIQTQGGKVVSDHLEVGAVPAAIRLTALQDHWSEAQREAARWRGGLPPNVQNAPSLLVEIEDQWCHWQTGQGAHMINLTLLPMSVEDIGFLDHHLGTGRVLILSRGYGNCRITNTCTPNTWRVVYYNSQDLVILNTVEICDVPEVALAAPEDLSDSLERLTDVLHWVEQAG
ncbi:hydrogenase expression/formation protein [Paucibacter sp. hw1]|uniref:Hydrogenase expression/formation protein n=2 Tax=Roseateles koreensis TaxID=2987526 RepID=A0ABT5KWI1_9BURK|nr:hydrogenase expression/formation protein [Roseateles koreensis]MDC8786142.1 hydrogenase expression/formation protein [Roseateles koreensis]